jgi:hypothetical protein
MQSSVSPADSAERQIELLEELVAWTRFASRSTFVATLEDQLKDPKHLRAFEASDGTQSQEEVGQFAGLSQASVSGLWARWKRAALTTSGPNGRARHLARPSDLGISVPPPAAEKVATGR